MGTKLLHSNLRYGSSSAEIRFLIWEGPPVLRGRTHLDMGSFDVLGGVSVQVVEHQLVGVHGSHDGICRLR